MRRPNGSRPAGTPSPRARSMRSVAGPGRRSSWSAEPSPTLRRSRVEGSPEFRRGERVLLFVSAYRDGTARVAHFYQGKFSIIRDAGGEDVAVRETAAGVHLPSGAAVPVTAPRHLRHLRDAIRAHVSA